MAEDLSPTGSSVVSTGVSSLGGFFSALGGLAVNGISRRIDLELAGDGGTSPDTSQTAPITNTNVQPPGFGSVISNLTPLQIGGLVVAAGLSWALATGKFR